MQYRTYILACVFHGKTVNGTHKSDLVTHSLYYLISYAFDKESVLVFCKQSFYLCAIAKIIH